MNLTPGIRLYSFTEEMIGLYDDMLLQIPDTLSIPVLALSICVTERGKRFLCITTHAPWSTEEIGYAHYHPDGCTANEVEEITAKHGCTLHSFYQDNRQAYLVAGRNLPKRAGGATGGHR